MKTSISLALTLAASALAFMLPTSNVFAATAVHHGSICHNYNPGQANDFNFYGDGVYNTASTVRYVICPLVVTHTPSQTTGSVYVDFNTATPLTCTLTSYTYSDVWLGSKTVTTGSGASRYAFIGPVPANSLSNHAVICSLPASYGGKIVAIESNF